MLTIDFDAIKAGVNITLVLSQYTQVPSHGRREYRMPCPLHNGQRDSFYVNEDKGTWYCHKCKEGGDVISLVAAFEKCRPFEAAQMLADGFNITARADHFVRTVRTTTRAMQNWKEAHERPPALDEAGRPETVELYAFRSLTKDCIDHFGVRLIPGKGWGEGVYIPITTEQGELVGYAVRHYDEFIDWFKMQHGKKCPKYLITHGLPKRGILFGLYENRDEILRAGFAYVVEGQVDAMTMWDRGYKNVVALMGSNMSPLQSHVLMRFTSKLVLMLDGDEAGQKGMQQIRERYGAVFSIKCVSLPEGEDPATADLKGLLEE